MNSSQTMSFYFIKNFAPFLCLFLPLKIKIHLCITHISEFVNYFMWFAFIYAVTPHSRHSVWHRCNVDLLFMRIWPIHEAMNNVAALKINLLYKLFVVSSFCFIFFSFVFVFIFFIFVVDFRG